MLGAIRKRDLLAHPVVTIRSFGWRVFVKAMLAGRDKTFLAILMETQVLPAPRVDVPEVLRRCAELERSAQRIYEELADRFDQVEPVRRFLLTLAHQEQGHAELLEVCRAALRKGRFDAQRFAPWCDELPKLEQTMQRMEASLDDVTSTGKAVQCVMDIETSEINRVFLGAVGASDAEFVQRLDVFRSTGKKHVHFIAGRIKDLEPSLAADCRRMLDALAEI
jgi:rubrerythrin